MQQQNVIKIESEKANDFKNVCKQIGIEVIKQDQPNQSQSSIKQPFQLNSSTNSHFNHKQQQIDSSSDSEDSELIKIQENQQETIYNQIDKLVEIQKRKLSKFNTDLRDLNWQMLIDEQKYSRSYIYNNNNNPKVIRSDQKPQQQQQNNQQYHSLNVFLKEFSEFDNNKQETQSNVSQQSNNNNQFNVYGNIVKSIKDDLKKLRIYNGNDCDVQKIRMFQDVLKDSNAIQEIDIQKNNKIDQYQTVETQKELKELLSSIQMK